VISAIKRFFESQLATQGDNTPHSREHRLRLASAALLFEVLKSDRHVDERETAAMRGILARDLDLDAKELDNIIMLAEEEARQAVSLYEFTSLINESYNYEERVQLIENMWKLALADDHLDMYEEQLIRRTADLIYVSHSDFIRTKLKVRSSQPD
jgi:uncharacterized tellurite resistance protein B-like protein